MLNFKFDALGWAASNEHLSIQPSPNFDARPEGNLGEISLLVIHNISLPPGQFSGDAVEQLFCNTLDCTAHPYYEKLRGLKVSAHFLIRRNGQVVQFVACAQRAWHAGVSQFLGRSVCNDFSIGIELEGADDVVFEAAQYQSLAQLTHALHQHYPLTHVAGHSHIAPGRKTDPGPCFDWARYAHDYQVLAHEKHGNQKNNIPLELWAVELKFLAQGEAGVSKTPAKR